MSLDKLPYSPYRVKIEKDIVNRIQNRRQNLVCNEQMPQIRPGICPAHGTATIRIDGRRVILIFSMFDDDVSAASEQPAVSCVTRRHHAIKHVDSEGDALDQVGRSSHPHQISWFF